MGDPGADGRGGFGAHLKLLTRFEMVKRNLLIERVLLEPMRSWPVFEDRRGHYLFQTLFDTHFLLFWVLAVLCMLAMYAALESRGWAPLVVLGALCGLLTLVHLYEGVTLLSVAASVTALYWIKGVRQRDALTVLAVVASVVGLCLGWQVWLAGRSGIPISSWREQSVLVSLLFMAYPLSWVLLARGLRRFWSDARPEHLFLLGWALGCTLLALSGPFNPYPQRGTLTLMIPIGLLAGLEYFRERPRVSATHAVVALLVLGPTPLWFMATTAFNMRFEPTQPATYLDSDHRDVVDALRNESTSQDVLLADPASNVWLAPDFGGRLYAGHFFLTVDFERKRREADRFFSAPSSEQRDFLVQKGIRFVFAGPRDASNLTEVDGLRSVLANTAGALYAFEPGPGHGR